MRLDHTFDCGGIVDGIAALVVDDEVVALCISGLRMASGGLVEVLVVGLVPAMLARASALSRISSA
jgi:hypothetical protein